MITLGAIVHHKADAERDSQGLVFAYTRFLDGHLIYRVSWADHSESEHIAEELMVDDPSQWSAG